MNVSLHIERVVLEGFDVPPSERGLLQAAIEAELTRLISVGGLATALQSGGGFETLAGGPIRPSPDSGAADVGEQIARALYGGIGGAS